MLLQRAMLWIERIAIAVAVAAIVAMMLITSWDAIGRYILGSPLPWAFQVTTYYLMATSLYLAIASTFHHGDHISIDMFRDKIPKRLLIVTDSISCLLAAGVFGIIAYGAWLELIHAYATRTFLPGNILWPAWLAFLPVAVGSCLVVARLIVHVIGLISGAETPFVGPEEEAL